MTRIRSSRTGSVRNPEELLAQARRRGHQIRRRRRGLSVAASALLAGGLASILSLALLGQAGTTAKVASPSGSRGSASSLAPQPARSTISPSPASSTPGSTPPPPTSAPSRSTPGSGPALAYVADNAKGGILVPVDLTTGRSETPIDLGATPVGLAITAGGTTGEVLVQTPSTGSSAIVPVNLATGAKGQPISLQGVLATAIVVTPDGKRAYLTAWHRDQVVPVDLATRTVESPISVPQMVSAIAMAPDGRTVYVATSSSSYNNATDQVVPLQVSSNALGPVLATIPGSIPVSAIAVAPGGHDAYLQLGSKGILSVNLATGQTGKVIGSSHTASTGDLAVSASGTMAYSPAQPNQGCALIPFDLAKQVAGQPITIAGMNNYCYNAALSADGSTAYVSDTIAGTTTTPNTGKLYAVDLATHSTKWVLTLPAGIQSGPGVVVVAP